MKTASALVIIFFALSALAAQECLECHRSADVLPPEHEKVDFVPASCPECHTEAGAGKTDPFRSAIHLKHAGSTECGVCHIYTGEKPFTVIGAKDGKSTDEAELIKDITISWQTSAYLDRRHAEANVFCSSCHGSEELPLFASSAGNDTCLACHGTLEELQKKTEPSVYKDRNPHKSHLGEVACSVCHLVHSGQTVYCMNCHPKFEMKTP